MWPKFKKTEIDISRKVRCYLNMNDNQSYMLDFMSSFLLHVVFFDFLDICMILLFCFLLFSLTGVK
mgnify:CR=1 FL=1